MPTRLSPPRIRPLPYPGDGARLLEAIAHRPWSVLLDSGGAGAGFPRGRYDLLCGDPFMTVVTHGGLTRVRHRDGSAWETREDPLEVLRRLLGEPLAPLEGLPFAGGAVGYLGYELGYRLEGLPPVPEEPGALPEMALGIYDWCVVVDHREARAYLATRGRDPATAGVWRDLEEGFARPATPRGGPPLRARGPLVTDLGPRDYATRFARLQGLIRDGDCYQVNLARRLEGATRGDPWRGYLALRRQSPAPFGAYLNLPWGQILCNSPERFLHLREGAVETCPIKGTRPRGGTAAEDESLRRELSDSPKDRAENVMIVDLLRNDLGRNCATGSVTVPSLFQVESYARVHHLVSTVTGRLAPGRDALDLLRGCFPGGSITGAPKRRAMEIIAQLEPHRRDVYCGAIGYIGFDGAMDTNIAIRTLVHTRGRIRFWAGGGVTNGSERDAEYRETVDKAAALQALLRPG
ncbi:aminodeoxychorismate synthase component I [Ectothiorhodospira mobilis]|uniref:aminodeoxychorismate synthase component I n=1 Tax=Ectothiorhodospira mobilis TaxID=195064 RepID=UPI001EE8EEC0|nr:aminodeoxychorismate synthase component I [Ectothiorhodospira mobilis]MCG5535164.1 aminodeoxychorismate synthase component I [Ectothiorhodospira mobilis]